MTLRQAQGERKSGAIDFAAIAASLGRKERDALMALDDAAWGKVPGLMETGSLLIGHGIPLIVVKGDWARRSRAGAAVCRELGAA